MCKLRSIFEVDFLNNVFLFVLRNILEVYFILKKSRSINEVFLKYKQSTLGYLKHTSIGLEGSEV